MLALCLIIQLALNVSTVKLLGGYNLAACSGMMYHFQSDVLFHSTAAAMQKVYL